MAELFENIKKLCLADGTSGDESDVTKLILSMLPQECDTKIDPLGNIIVNKKGAKAPKQGYACRPSGRGRIYRDLHHR